MSKQAIKRVMGGHVPGPVEQAAMKVHYERGSQAVVDRNKWRTMAFLLVVVIIGMSGGFVALLPLKSVEVVRVGQEASGRVVVDAQQQVNREWGDEVQMAWVSDWARMMFEVNAPTWRRSVGKALSLTVGTAKSQSDDYLRLEENNPPYLLGKDPSFVREVERVSVNVIQPNVVLIRFRLITRWSNGNKTVKQLAMTATLKQTTQTSREEIIENPSGLLLSNFSISDESSATNPK